jgi:hypothetical protein
MIILSEISKVAVEKPFKKSGKNISPLINGELFNVIIE